MEYTNSISLEINKKFQRNDLIIRYVNYRISELLEKLLKLNYETPSYQEICKIISPIYNYPNFISINNSFNSKEDILKIFKIQLNYLNRVRNDIKKKSMEFGEKIQNIYLRYDAVNILFENLKREENDTFYINTEYNYTN